MKKGIIFTIIIVLLLGIGIFLLYQFTEVFGEKLVPIKIEQMTIDYVPGYSLEETKTLNQKKEVVKVQTISISGKDFKKMKSEMHFFTKKNFTKKQFGGHQIDLHINKDVTIQVGNGYGYVIKKGKKTKIKIPNRTMNVIHQIIRKDQKKRVQSIETESVTVKLEGASITIKNAENLGNIQKYLSYYPILLEDDYKTFDNGYLAELILDKNQKVYLYSSKLGYIINGEEQEYGIFQEDLYNLVKKIYDYSVQS